jgi:hypothetical protein
MGGRPIWGFSQQGDNLLVFGQIRFSFQKQFGILDTHELDREYEFLFAWSEGSENRYGCASLAGQPERNLSLSEIVRR